MATVIDLTALLGNAQSPDANVRNQAEQQLKQLQEQQYPSFLLSLATELGNNEKPIDARRLAGLILKNTLDAKDEARKARPGGASRRRDRRSVP
jgi:importin subunit beta-1